MTTNRAVLPVHGHAGKIADVLVGTGELVEEGRLAAILVAGKGKGEGGSLGKRMFACFDMVASALAQTGMLHGRMRRRAGGLAFYGAGIADFNPLRVVHAQGQLIAVDAEFDGVAHRGEFDERNLCAGDDTHIQKMLSEGAFAADGMDDGTLTGFKRIQSHRMIPPISY